MFKPTPRCFAVLVLACLTALPFNVAAGDRPALFARENLVAWCIVPFDSKMRTPAERAAMVRSLGIRKIAYDWRKQHVPQFEEEILAYQKEGLEFFAFWGVHEDAFRLFQKYDLRPQIWHTLAAPKSTEDRDAAIREAAAKMLPQAQRTRDLGCAFGLYNHGGWGGEPENLVAVCEYLRTHHGLQNVGIVYNLHHAHGALSRFAPALELMRPYLLCLNLNGMVPDGDQRGMKIQPLGQGELDVALLRDIVRSGYRGPIGLIGHTMDDVELRLRDNLDGLDWIVDQLQGGTGPRPRPRVSLLPEPRAHEAR